MTMATYGSARQAAADNLFLLLKNAFQGRQNVSLGVLIEPDAIMRRGHNGVDAVGLGHPAHFQGLVHILSPVIQAGKDVGVEVNHRCLALLSPA